MILLVLLAVFSMDWAFSQECVTVDGEWITARDLSHRIPHFATEDPELRLTRAPFPGARRLLVPASLPGGSSDSIEPFCVERQMRSYLHEEFSEAIRQSLARKEAKEIRFELLDYDRSPLPSGKLEFLVQALPPVIQAHTDNAVLWRGKLYYSESRSVPVWARLRLWIESDVCVLTHDVARGADLKESDCQITATKYPPFSPAPVRDPAMLERTTAARRMTSHEPIYQALLVRKPDVELGKLVELRVINGGTQLKFQAKAAGSAHTGESVAVTNPSNGKRLEGKVVGKDTVEVRLK